MESRTSAAVILAAILTGSTLLPATAMAEDVRPVASDQAPEPASGKLQQDIEARVQKDAEAMASDAMTAASDLDFRLDLERVSPRALVLVSDI